MWTLDGIFHQKVCNEIVIKNVRCEIMRKKLCNRQRNNPMNSKWIFLNMAAILNVSYFVWHFYFILVMYANLLLSSYEGQPITDLRFDFHLPTHVECINSSRFLFRKSYPIQIQYINNEGAIFHVNLHTCICLYVASHRNIAPLYFVWNKFTFRFRDSLRQTHTRFAVFSPLDSVAFSFFLTYDVHQRRLHWKYTLKINFGSRKKF